MKSAVYFPNLNGLRFLAALLVFIHHVEQFKLLLHIPHHFDNPFVQAIGKLGVILFFVLSGFLITFILLKEEEGSGSIHIRKFYLRRILRIWPLYFLVITFALLILPNFKFFIIPGYEKEVLYENFVSKAVLYFTFFSNLAVSLYNIFPYASQAWSIGTEEQFYLLWPLLFVFIRKNRIWLLLAVIGIYIGLYFLLNSDVQFVPGKMYLRKFWKLFNIDCMAIGALMAVLLYKRKLLKLLMHNAVFYATLLACGILMAFGVTFPHLNYELYAVLFAIIILNFAANDTIGISLENRWMDYLGKISYGLYMYHILAIVITLKLLSMAGLPGNWSVYPIAFILTVAIAALSYEFFEKYFIRKKKKYSDVVSGENAKRMVIGVPVNIVHAHSESHYSSHRGYNAAPRRLPAAEDSGTDEGNAV